MIAKELNIPFSQRDPRTLSSFIQADIALMLQQQDFELSHRLHASIEPYLNAGESSIYSLMEFRNKMVGEYSANLARPEDVDLLEGMLRREGTLNISIRNVVLPTNGHHTDDLSLIGATERGKGEMNQSVWIRDQSQYVMSALEVYLSDRLRYDGHGRNARHILNGLLTVMSTPAQLARFEKIIDQWKNTNYLADSANWPHIFLNMENLNAEKTENWSHKQDAWQMLAYATFEALDKGLITVDQLTQNHKTFLGYIVPFLKAVDFTNRANSGSWEEIEAVRSSTMAWEVAVLDKIRSAAHKPGYHFLIDGYHRHYDKFAPTSASFISAIDTMYDQGLERLEQMHPFESPLYQGDDPRYREADGALIYLLQLNIPERIATRHFPNDSEAGKRQDLSLELEAELLQQIYTLIDNETNGIRRYHGDTYQAQDFWSHQVQSQLRRLYAGGGATSDFSRSDHFVGRNRIVGQQKKEAAWSHFNFQLSAWAGRRFLETNREYYLNKQRHFLQAGLSMITGEHEFSILQNSGLHVQGMPAFRVPECRFAHTVAPGEVALLPGPFTPLNWGVAELEEALISMRTSLSE